MSKRDKRLQLIRQLAAESVVDHTETVEMLRNKFPELESMEFGTKALTKGMVVLYVPTDKFNRVSFGICVGFKHDSSDNVIGIVLLNKKYKRVWTISTGKNFIFWRKPERQNDKERASFAKLLKALTEDDQGNVYLRIKKKKKRG